MNNNDFAFPIMPPSGPGGFPPDGYPFPSPGMSLRDYMAIHANLEDGPSVLAAKAVMECEPPQWNEGDGMICTLWWAEAEARIRYIFADAMLKQREPR